MDKVKEPLTSGYRTLYDPFPALHRLKSDRQDALDELWENLYHQGDVGTASYAAVPLLVETGELELVSAIEVARHEPHNPKLPTDLIKPYEEALRSALHVKLETEEQYQGYYIIHASLNNQHRLAKALLLLSPEEVLSEYS